MTLILHSIVYMFMKWPIHTYITLKKRRIGDGNILFYSSAVIISKYVPKKRASIYK
jgi:hypothetical protein